MSPRSFITEVCVDEDAGTGCNADRPCGRLSCDDCVIEMARRPQETRDEERARLAYEREHSPERLG